MKPYHRGEIVFVRCRVMHDYRGSGPHPLAGPVDGVGGNSSTETHPGEVVLIETVGPDGRVDRDGNHVVRVPSAHVVSVAEIKAKLGGGA